MSNAKILATWVGNKKKWHLLYVHTHTKVLHDILFFEGQLKGVYYQRGHLNAAGHFYHGQDQQ